MKRCFILLAALACAVSPVLAARVAAVAGSPEILTSPEASWKPLDENSVVPAGSHVRCGRSSRADIVTDDGHRIRVWPDSEAVLDNIDSPETMVTLARGRLRSWVRKLRGADTFRVKTPVAVCSVRGTDFSVELGGDSGVRVEVYEGAVAAREEKTGGEVTVRAGEFSTILPDSAPSEPRNLSGEGSDEAGSPVVINETREEARREVFQEIGREAVMARANEEIKKAEFQNGKAVIDASGNRVRLAEYIIRTQPNEFKYVVLNTRENRFDFGKIVFTFNDTLPDDLSLATRTMYTAAGPERPRWWLTDVLSVMSNTVDQVNEEASGGQMFPDNPANPTVWTHGFLTYAFSVNNKIWWRYADANANGRLERGEIFLYDLNGNPLSGMDSTSSQPSGPGVYHFRDDNVYGPAQWISLDKYVIDDNGNIISNALLSDQSLEERNKTASDYNFELVYAASVFNGRKIDLVFSAKLLIDAGLLSLPAPRVSN